MVTYMVQGSTVVYMSNPLHKYCSWASSLRLFTGGAPAGDAAECGANSWSFCWILPLRTLENFPMHCMTGCLSGCLSVRLATARTWSATGSTRTAAMPPKPAVDALAA